MINELRKSHYSLGNDEPMYRSETRDNIKAYDGYRDDSKKKTTQEL